MDGERKKEYQRQRYAKMSVEEKQKKLRDNNIARKRKKQFSNLEIACLPSTSTCSGFFFLTQNYYVNFNLYFLIINIFYLLINRYRSI
ncbi:hypothetical protein KFK09_023417 [Dendrobium nobile]|uniref:Uncharacterized protein n=1 Tax=Dendrobium nobile TaxID=94219 RepID=A0A8T3AL07_DENNO|nr:hypothetical protein KFK09_023417 [Dendrobium nobile]